MAIINQRTGYFGFTLDGTSGADPIDANGQVRRCIFAIVYPLQVNDIEFQISKKDDDWGAQMGDGSIVPLSNPVILFQNRDNSIVQFDMSTPYPSNSPCVLVYRSDSAYFNVKQLSSARPFTPNSVSGHFAFTVEGYGGSQTANGLVDRLIATIPFPQQSAHVVFTITNDPSHWGARMGDGSIISLRNPVILYTNAENAVVQFSMDTPYPSNSPCVLVYRSESASFNIHVDAAENEFIPVADIINVPDDIRSGKIIDLSAAETFPVNATQQGAIWKVISGPGSISNNKLLATGTGTIVAEITIINGKGSGSNFTKRFSINITTNTVDVYADPQSEVKATFGHITEKIYIHAVSDDGIIYYQWYKNSVNNTNNAVAISGATSEEYFLPKNIEVGDYYYFCEVSSPGATPVKSRISHVNVDYPLDGVSIYPTDNTIEITQERQLHFNPIPKEVNTPVVTWHSSDSAIIQVSSTGMIKAINSGTATITAKSVNGTATGSLTLTVPEFHSVTNITGVIASAVTNQQYRLTPTIVPSNATHKDINWLVVSSGQSNEAQSTIDNGTFTAHTLGVAVIRLIIEHGISPVQDYVRDFSIKIDKEYIPVNDVNLTNKSARLSRTADDIQPYADDGVSVSSVYVGEKMILDADVSPIDASYRYVTYQIASAGVTGATIKDGNELTVKNPGSFTVNTIIKNGKTSTTNFVKTFNMTAFPGRVPVASAQFTIDEWNPHPINGEATPLEIEILPANATERHAQITLKDPGVAKVSFDESTNSISCDPSIMTYEMEEADATFEIRIPDGIAKGVDYTSDVKIRITLPTPPDIFTPVTDINIDLPTPMRALYPVLLKNEENITIYPWNANEKNIQFESERHGEKNGTNAILYNPMQYDFSSDITSNFFDWNLDTIYIFPWNPGKLRLTATIVNGDTTDHDNIYCQDLLDYVKEWILEFDQPFIPVKDIGNIPAKINCKQDIVLTGEPITLGGTGFYNPFWDEEESTFKEIEWRIGAQYFDMNIYPNTANAVVKSGNIVYANNPGVFTIQAHIVNGIKEPIQWYDKEQIGEDYTKLFTIRVEEAETPQTDPILTLTLNNGNKVKVYKKGDMTKLCSDLPSTAQITIENKTFRKDQVIEVKFGDNVSVITSLTNFGRNFTNLTKIDRIPGLTNSECYKNFLRGCTSFNQDIVIPANINGAFCLSYFLRDCTSFNSNITFEGSITGAHSLHGFLYGCTSFNKPIQLPSDLTGEGCLERFLMKCTSFNQDIVIPSGITGPCCLRDFMTECSSFNKPIQLPDDVGDMAHELGSMMRDCSAMCSDIYVPLGTGEHGNVNEQTFSCVYRESAMIQNGVTLTGPGAVALMDKMENSLDTPAYKNLRVQG